MNRENERLKNKILDLAIRGKLVPQDINDEPASVLLEKIKQERKKLIAEKKIKQENFSEIYKNPTDNHYYEKFEDGTINDITEEIPFEIPNTWCWCRLHSLGNIVGGGTPKTELKENWENATIPWLTPADMKNITGKYVSKGERNISLIGLKNSSAQIMPKGTILYSSRAPIGYIAIAENPICTNQGFKSIVLINEKLNNFIYYELIQKTPDIISKASGTTFKEISGSEFGKTIIAIPPIEEQNRIIEKLEIALEYLNKKDNNEKKLFKLKRIFKSKILNKAIQGKLVKQDFNDESAEILINKILDEKRALMKSKEIKKENLSIIYKDSDNQFYEKFDDGKIINITEEIPFDIPKNWRWSRLSTICTKIVDGDHNPPQGQNIQTEYIMLSAKNIQNNQLVNFSDARFLSKEDYDKGKQRISLKNGDILLTIVGTLGRSCIYKDIGKNILFQRSVSVISTLINNNYLKFVFDSSYIQNKMQKESTGTAQRGFYLNQLSNVLIPVPPINEEFFIINKLNELLKTAE